MNDDRRSFLFPLVAAWFHTTALATSALADESVVEDLGWALFLATMLAVIAWLTSATITRKSDQRVLISIGFVACWAASGMIVADGSTSPKSTIMLLGAVAACGATLYRIVRTERVIRVAAEIVRRAVVIAFAFAMASLIAGYVRSPSDAVAADARPDTYDLSGFAGPNIYLIVLDKYTGTRSLLENYGFDNRPFEEALVSRGFRVPARARSNYPHTWFSLASMLNWQHVAALMGTAPEAEWRDKAAAAIEDNETWRFLRRHGYEFVVFPSTFPQTRANRFADLELPERGPAAINLASRWIVSSPIYPALRLLAKNERVAFPYQIETGQEVARRLAAIGEYASSPGPFYAFIHLLVPHEPYVFEADCAYREPYWPASDYSADSLSVKQAYVDQIKCLNEMLLATIDTIIERSSVPPIILFQADHGHGMISIDPLIGTQPPFEALDSRQVAERTDIFAAYYLPDGGSSAVSDSITPVNLFPSVLNYYFDAGIPLREDAVFWMHLQPPHRLRRID